MLQQMLSKNYSRRLAIILLIAVVLFAALGHGGKGIAAAILIPVWLCFGAIVCLIARRVEEHAFVWLSPVLPVFSPRPPPSAS
jgi:hypothetical protein